MRSLPLRTGRNVMSTQSYVFTDQALEAEADQWRRGYRLAVGETVDLLLAPPPLLSAVGISIWTVTVCQPNDSLADGYYRLLLQNELVMGCTLHCRRSPHAASSLDRSLSNCSPICLAETTAAWQIL